MNHLIDAITTGNAQELCERIESNSIDLILCDPLWWEIEAYRWLGQFSRRVLKPYRYVIAQVGAYYLFDAMNAMAESLDYYWLIQEPLHQATPFFKYQIVQFAKPWLWFSKGLEDGKPGWRGWALDRVFSPKAKSNHLYEDGVASLIILLERLTQENDLVLDPFAGSGTVAAACKILNRRCISFEIDPEQAQLARERVSLVNHPLLVPDPVQLSYYEE